MNQGTVAISPVPSDPRSPNSSSASIFKDVTEQAGLKFQHYNGFTGKFYLPEITGSGAALIDFDIDGDLDVFVVQSSVITTKEHQACDLGKLTFGTLAS